MSLFDGIAWEKENPPTLINCLRHKEFQVVYCKYCSQEYIDVAKHVGIKADQGKPRLGLVLVEVPHAFEKLGTLLGFGADKYAVGNWDKVQEGEMRYLDALMRHLTQHHKGEKVDPESGELHLAHAAVNIMFLLDKELRK